MGREAMTYRTHYTTFAARSRTRMRRHQLAHEAADDAAFSAVNELDECRVCGCQIKDSDVYDTICNNCARKLLDNE
jgi:hypothetical protein